MRLIQLTEDESIDWTTISNNIKRDCKPYLTKYKNVKLFRGMQSSVPHIKKPVRKNRNPTDSNILVHQALNKASVSTYGIPFRNGLFVVPSKSEATYYGYTYQVFPIGKFDYLWSPSIKDLFSYIQGNGKYENISELVKPVIDSKDSEQTKLKKLEDIFITMFDDKYVKNSGLEKADKEEIMFMCDEYYAVLTNHTSNLTL